MFERYTETARRVIFFGRYEASRYGSSCIESEHLLLGILREYRGLAQILPQASADSIRQQIDAHTLTRPSIATSVDLPLSVESKRALAYGADEADLLKHRRIGPEHLILGLLREEACFAARILAEKGLTLEKLRERFANITSLEIESVTRLRPPQDRVAIYGIPWHADTIRERVKLLRKHAWHWQKQSWKARDVAVNKEGKLSFDLNLAKGSDNFDLRAGGWQRDRCPICFWELFEDKNQPEHSTGFTNGRDWVCNECHEKFLQDRDYFESSNSDIT